MMLHSEKVENYLKEWNHLFPFDKWFRDKYKISLFSKEHLELNQIDIYLEWKETQIFNEYINIVHEQEEKEKQYKSGKLLKERISPTKEEKDWFDNIDVLDIKE